MFPLVIFGIAALVIVRVAATVGKPLLKVGGDDPGMVWVNDHWERRRATNPNTPGQGQTPNLDALNQMLLAGMPVPPQLYPLAYQEAVTTGDLESAQAIQRIYRNSQGQQVVTGAEGLDADDGGDAERAREKYEALAAEHGDVEMANPGPVAATIRAPAVAPPPIDGVEPDEWQAFAKALHTKDPTYRSDRHLGAYEHHRQRLRALGIPEAQLATEDGQYQALCSDVADYTKKCKGLISDFTGDAVEVNGQVHPITMSGLLGVLKAAGPAGAEGWLKNPEDRAKFPRTTETFLRTNNCF